MIVRRYEPTDEPGWLRCRVLSFLGSAYFDDVKRAKTPLDRGVELVAIEGPDVVGVLDVELFPEGLATIDTIAVHPDHQRRGVAGALLGAALAAPELAEAEVLDLWTREDVAANAWYVAHGFAEVYRYLHVYVSGTEADAFPTPDGLALVHGFFHAVGVTEGEEDALRAQYERVHTCRQYVRRRPAAGWTGA